MDRKSEAPAARWQTHAVENVVEELVDYDLFGEDAPLRAAVERDARAGAATRLQAFGQQIGRAEYLHLGDAANRYRPELATHDAYGRRLDQVTYHPAYHQLMQTAIAHGLHALPWSEPGVGVHAERAAFCYLHTQVEAGHGCPITMSFAAMPALRAAPSLSFWREGLLSRQYDERNIPAPHKRGLTLGMGMTEKQGGSDVRSNTTRAYPLAAAGAYELVGHKFFLSAPMSDAFLMLAQAPGGLSCFLVPRWRDEGEKNMLELVRLKEKMGNASNASSEVELRGALGWLVGEEGRGIATILEMVSLTRFDCMIGSAAGMRMAFTQAAHHASRRRAFGRLLVQQPLMQNVLADLALESEAALLLGMRMARALDGTSEEEKLLARIAVAIGKYWICKRAPQHAYEAMECIGGTGVMETCMLPRLYREAPINAIWEGSGNVQCLDVLRVLHKSPQALPVLFAEILQAGAQHPLLAAGVRELRAQMESWNDAELEYGARYCVDRLAILLQASLMLRYAPSADAFAYCDSRLARSGAQMYGGLAQGAPVQAVLRRAWRRAFD